jgi:hypothetical protein
MQRGRPLSVGLVAVAARYLGTQRPRRKPARGDLMFCALVFCAVVFWDFAFWRMRMVRRRGTMLLLHYCRTPPLEPFLVVVPAVLVAFF